MRRMGELEVPASQNHQPAQGTHHGQSPAHEVLERQCVCASDSESKPPCPHLWWLSPGSMATVSAIAWLGSSSPSPTGTTASPLGHRCRLLERGRGGHRCVWFCLRTRTHMHCTLKSPSALVLQPLSTSRCLSVVSTPTHLSSQPPGALQLQPPRLVLSPSSRSLILRGKHAPVPRSSSAQPCPPLRPHFCSSARS